MYYHAPHHPPPLFTVINRKHLVNSPLPVRQRGYKTVWIQNEDHKEIVTAVKRNRHTGLRDHPPSTNNIASKNIMMCYFHEHVAGLFYTHKIQKSEQFELIKKPLPP